VTLCPEPKCEAHDHHDSLVECDNPKLYKIAAHPGAENWLTTDFNNKTTGSHNYAVCKYAFDPTDAVKTQCLSDNQRSFMAQWLLTYEASDDSGNDAEKVTFSFVFVDLFAPVFQFGSADSTLTYSKGFKPYQWWGDINAYFEGNLRLKSEKFGEFSFGNSVDRKSFGRFCAPDGRNTPEGVEVPYSATTCQDSSGDDSYLGTWATGTTDVDGRSYDRSSLSDPNMKKGKADVDHSHYALVAGNLDISRYGKRMDGANDDTKYTSVGSGRTVGKTYYNMHHQAISHDENRNEDYNDAKATVYHRVDGGSWSSDDNANINTLDMTKPITVDFSVTDTAGRFGFKGTSNSNMHRLEFRFSDAIHPRIYLACYSSQYSMDRREHADGLGGKYDECRDKWKQDNPDVVTKLEVECEEKEFDETQCNDFVNEKIIPDMGTHCFDIVHDAHERRQGFGQGNPADECDSGVTRAAHERGDSHSCAYKHVATSCSSTHDGHPTNICHSELGEASCEWEDEAESTVTLECGTDYTAHGTRVVDEYLEAGAYFIDNVDSWGKDIMKAEYTTAHSANYTEFTEKGWLKIEYTEVDANGVFKKNAENGVSTVFPAGHGTFYKVKYTGEDAQGLAAEAVIRTVKVVDRSAPRITLVGDHTIQNSAGSDTQTSEGYDPTFEDEACTSEPKVGEPKAHILGCFNHADYKGAVQCKDECTPDAHLVEKTQLYQFDVGYKGSGCDTAGNGLHEGDGREEIDAGKSWTFPEYKTGIYAILYTCEDLAGNKATACRTINNVDHTKPIIQILGSDEMSLEATHQGNYIDDGATCSDQVDGVISQNVEVSGDVVNLSKVGTYTIMYNCKDAANRPADQAVRTVTVSQTSCPTCAMECYSHEGGKNKTTTDEKGTLHYCNQPHEASFEYTDAGATCSDVIDGDTEVECDLSYVQAADGHGEDADREEDFAVPEAADSSCNRQLVNANRVGTYVITYKSRNSVGKWNYQTTCRGGYNKYVRSVIVEDTLRPIITLDYNGTQVAQGDEEQYVAGQTHLGRGETHNADWAAKRDNSPLKELHRDRLDGWHENNEAKHGGLNVGSEDNPHGTHHGLMAEEATTSGVNGWVLGAIASAVTGLALLGYSQRKTTVATSVPV